MGSKRPLVRRLSRSPIALLRRVGESLRETGWDGSLLPEDREYLGVVGTGSRRLLGNELRAEVDADLDRNVGADPEEAVRNSWTDQALYADYLGDGSDGFMDFEELMVNLQGLLEFPTDLIVENERPLRPDPEALASLLAPGAGGRRERQDR